MRVDPPPPWGTLLFRFDTLWALEQLRLQPNDTLYPHIFKCNISIGNCPLALKINTEVKYLKLQTKIVND